MGVFEYRSRNSQGILIDVLGMNSVIVSTLPNRKK